MRTVRGEAMYRIEACPQHPGGWRPKQEFKKLQRTFKGLRYCDLDKISSPLIRSVTRVRQEPSKSSELV